MHASQVNTTSREGQDTKSRPWESSCAPRTCSLPNPRLLYTVQPTQPLPGSEQDELHAAHPEALDEVLVAEDVAEEVLAALGHVEQRALLGVHVRHVQDQVREVRQGEGLYSTRGGARGSAECIVRGGRSGEPVGAEARGTSEGTYPCR